MKPPAADPEATPLADRLHAAMASLHAAADPAYRDNLKPRYGIDAPTALGVRMADMKGMAKPLRRDHALAGALWSTGVYEARMLATMVADPKAVTPELADRWRGDFDNWAICDTACFNLFDRVAFAFDKVDQWVRLNDEFGRRAGFALLATLALHKKGETQDFLDRMVLIEQAAEDDRNFVKKGVNWALRAIGGKTDPALGAAARDLADRLVASDNRTARWIGKDAQRYFARNDAKKAGAA